MPKTRPAKDSHFQTQFNHGKLVSESSEATKLLDRWRGGDEDAAAELFQLYSRKLTGVAERQMSRKLSQRVDGEDVVQSAFRTFFRRGERGDFTIDNSAGLWRLLVKITLAKVHSQARRHTSPKRDMNAEAAADGLELPLMVNEPGPDEAAALVDLMQAAVDNLPETYGEILALRLAGHTRSEIAAELGITRQTVYRALGIIGQRCEQLLTESLGGTGSSR